jgi:hypothetical protein
MTRYYERLGWTVIERKVGANQLNAFVRDARAESDQSEPYPAARK